MLVLSRQKDETIRIDLPDGRHIDVTVVDIRGDKVRLGTTAPKDCGIDRIELWDEKRRHERAAAGEKGEP